MAEPGAWQRLPENARRLFGVDLTTEHLTKLETFLDLVEAWSTRMNLVGRMSRDELIDRHVLDSLAPTGLLRDAKVAADLGSGAGFPAIPMAVVRPRLALHLVESRRKRVSFLRQVSRSLELGNVAISEARAEEWETPQTIDVVIGRALAAPTLASLAARLLSAGGRMFVMRKQGVREAFAGFSQIDVRSYRLPGGERHEIAAYERIS